MPITWTYSKNWTDRSKSSAWIGRLWKTQWSPNYADSNDNSFHEWFANFLFYRMPWRFRALGNHEDEGRLLAYDSEHTHLFNESGTVGLKPQLYMMRAKLHFSGVDLLGLSISTAVPSIFRHMHKHVSWSALICLALLSNKSELDGTGSEGPVDLIPFSWSCYITCA